LCDAWIIVEDVEDPVVPMLGTDIVDLSNPVLSTTDGAFEAQDLIHVDTLPPLVEQWMSTEASARKAPG
jgi:hypothetical protein